MNKFVKKLGWIVALSVFLLTLIGVLFFNSPLEKLHAAKKENENGQTLQGARMEFQSLKSNGTWNKFNVTNDDTNYTTNSSGEIVLSKDTAGKQVFSLVNKKAAVADGSVTVNYYIENTTTALQNSVTINGNVGDYVPVSTSPATLTKNGITYELTTSAELDGTEVALPIVTVQITNQKRTLNFYYKAITTKATTTPGGTVTVWYLQGEGEDIDYYKYVDGSKIELNGNVGEWFDVTSSSVDVFTDYEFKVAYINWINPGTKIEYPAVKVTVTDNPQTVWVYYQKVKDPQPQYYLYQDQGKPLMKTYAKDIWELNTEQWKELFGNGNTIAVKRAGKVEPLAYLDQTKYTFTPELDETQTPWNSKVEPNQDETTRTFKVKIDPTPELFDEFPGLRPIVADAKFTFIDAAYTLQLMIRKPGQDGKVGEVVPFADSTDHPFMLQDDISKDIGDDDAWHEGTVNATDRTIVGFPGFKFKEDTQYRVKQTATPNANLALWDVDNKSMTKPFSFEYGEAPKLTVYDGDGGGDDGEYSLPYYGSEVAISADPDTATWFAKYDISTKVLTFYFVNEEVPPGELTWTVPKCMNFGDVDTQVRQAQKIFLQERQGQNKWQIVVSDTRQENRDPWQITAKLTKPFIDDDNQKQLPENILKFKSTADGDPQYLSQGAVIHLENSPEKPETRIDWDNESGFYLDLISNGYYPVGQYVGNVTFTLTQMKTP